MPLKGKGKWVKDKILVLPPKEDCYIYKRPGSNTYQYFLAIEGEGAERKTTGKTDIDDAKSFALDRKLEVMSRKKQGMKARRIRKLFDFIDEYLEYESKRIASYNKPGFITEDTFKGKTHHLKNLKRFLHGIDYEGNVYPQNDIRLEDLDYVKLKEYPLWRTRVDKKWNPTPPKTNHTILSELTTIRAYFQYLLDKGFIPKLPEFRRIQRESMRNNRRDYLNVREYSQTLNTLRKWRDASNITPTNSFNRKLAYFSILVMSNSLLRIGELRGLRWMDLEENSNLSKEDRKIGHLIKVRKEITKTGQPRTVQSATVKWFNAIRELTGIPKVRGSKFPHIPPEYRSQYILHVYNHPEKELGKSNWDRMWKEIKELCADRYWNMKNVSWYSFRHTGISFSVSRGVPLLLLARNAGTGLKYIEDVYFHHESESKQTWETLTQNRKFYETVHQKTEDQLVDIADAVETIEV